jgi:hypothetical protein
MVSDHHQAPASHQGLHVTRRTRDTHPMLHAACWLADGRPAQCHTPGPYHHAQIRFRFRFPSTNASNGYVAASSLRCCCYFRSPGRRRTRTRSLAAPGLYPQTVSGLLLSHAGMHAVRLAHPVSNRSLLSGNLCIVCRSIPTCLWSVHARVTKFKFANLWIKCSPDAVSTTPLTWPFSSRNAASSNSFCMSPRPKNPLSNRISHAPCPCTYTRHFAALTNRRPCAHCCSLTRLSPAPTATWALRRQPLTCPRTS